MNKLALTVLMFCIFIHVYSMDSGTTTIFHPSFKSLQVVLNGNDQSPAIIIDDTTDHITIDFDEIADTRRWMRYRLVHCDAYWKPDGIPEQMYVDGFNEALVENYRFSQATTVNYVHYSITLPNDKIKLKISGNYLLQVFDENNPDQPLLQARFMVCENKVAIKGSVSPRTDIDYEASHQQLTLEIEPKKIDITDPYRDMFLFVRQNGREDNAVVVKNPMRIAGQRMFYEHIPSLIFPAGNEYRRFENITINYPGMHVEEMSFSDPFYHATLYVDAPRSYSSYIYDKTQHGRFRIRNFDTDDSETEAEYVLTHFSLDMPELDDYDIFLDGDFTHRRFTPESRMVYNRNTMRYENTQLLKQGAYNYQYLAVPYGSMKGDTKIVEGDYYQTINEYDVAVYYHKPGELYDRLVGFARLESNR